MGKNSMSFEMPAGGTVLAGNYPPIDGFSGYEFKQGDLTMPYRLLVPGKLDAGKCYPLILSIHGMGSIGDDNQKGVL